MSITLLLAKQHLRVTHTDEDTLIQQYLDAAQDYVVKFLNLETLLDNSSIDAAILLVIGDLYRNREGASDRQIKENPVVLNLLHPYRENIQI